MTTPSTIRRRSRALGLAVVAALTMQLAPVTTPAAQGGQCIPPVASKGSVRAANDLLRNRYTFPPHPTVRLPADLRWNEDPLRDPNWAFQLHTLRFTWNLWDAWTQTAEPRYLQRFLDLHKDWVEDNPRSKPRSWWAWRVSSTSRRALVLVCAAENLALAPWIVQSLMEHGEVLADRRTWWYHGNHAAIQAMALLAVGCTVGREDWRDVAARRIERLGKESIDAQGVDNEQSTQYHSYNWRVYGDAMARMTACGVSPSVGLKRRHARMVGFMAHATTPDGTLELLGDTSKARTPAVPGTTAQFASTLGAQGVRPSRPSAIYGAGFAFGRTGWGERRRFTEETFWSMRFGPGRKFHGHDEDGAVTLWADGEPLLIDPGRYRYRKDALRRWYVGPYAHNIVTVDGSRYSSRRSAPLLSSKRTPLLDHVRIAHRKWRGVRHERSMLFSRRGGYMVVADTLTGSRERTFRQQWHLPPAARVGFSTRGFAVRSGEAELAVRQLVDGHWWRRTSGWASLHYGQKRKAPVVQVMKRGEDVRYVTLIAPSRDGRLKLSVRAFRLLPNGYELTVRVNGVTERVLARGAAVSVASVA